MTYEFSLDEWVGVELHWFLQKEKVTEQDRQFTQTHYNKKNNSLHGKEYTAGEMWMGDEEQIINDNYNMWGFKSI